MLVFKEILLIYLLFIKFITKKIIGNSVWLNGNDLKNSGSVTSELNEITSKSVLR